MIPIDKKDMPSRFTSENPEQEKRRAEVQEFWDSGADCAELTIFNPNTLTQTELKHYEKASRQLRLGYSHIRFCQRKGKIYAIRIAEKGAE